MRDRRTVVGNLQQRHRAVVLMQMECCLHAGFHQTHPALDRFSRPETLLRSSTLHLDLDYVVLDRCSRSPLICLFCNNWSCRRYLDAIRHYRILDSICLFETLRLLSPALSWIIVFESPSQDLCNLCLRELSQSYLDVSQHLQTRRSFVFQSVSLSFWVPLFFADCYWSADEV